METKELFPGGTLLNKKKKKTRKFCVKHILSTTFSKGHSETEAHVMCTLTILR